MADDILEVLWCEGPEDSLMADAPEDAESEKGFPLWAVPLHQNAMSNARRISMYRDDNQALMAFFLEIICMWEMGKPSEDPQAFDGNPARLHPAVVLQDGVVREEHDPGAIGAAHVEVRGAAGYPAASVRKTNNVSIPPASPIS